MMEMYNHITKKILIKEYIKNRLSSTEIAETLKCSDGTIRYKLKECGIKIRSASEAALNKNIIGKNNPNWKGGRKSYCKNCKKPNTFRCQLCMKCANQKRIGKNHPRWNPKRHNKKYYGKDIIDHHIYLKENSDETMKLNKADHRKLHARAYDYLVNIKQVNKYIKWFIRKYKIKKFHENLQSKKIIPRSRFH